MVSNNVIRLSNDLRAVNLYLRNSFKISIVLNIIRFFIEILQNIVKFQLNFIRSYPTLFFSSSMTFASKYKINNLRSRPHF